MAGSWKGGTWGLPRARGDGPSARADKAQLGRQGSAGETRLSREGAKTWDLSHLEAARSHAGMDGWTARCRPEHLNTASHMAGRQGSGF